MAKYTEILAKNVGSLFEESRLTQVQFAEKAGITQPNLNRFLRGKVTNPNLKTLEKIGHPFGKDPIWLLSDHSRPRIQDMTSPQIRAEITSLLPTLDEPELSEVLGMVRGFARARAFLNQAPQTQKKRENKE